MNKTIYELDLHESIEFEVNSGHLNILKVPGGWLYEKRVPGVSVSVTFVPYDDEYDASYTDEEHDLLLS